MIEEIAKNNIINSIFKYEYFEETHAYSEKLDIFSKYQELHYKGIKFKFSDIKWDFKQLSKDGKDKTNYIFNFENKKYKLDTINEFVLKEYVLWMINSFGIHSGGNKNRFCVVKRFIKYVQSNDINIFNIDLDIIKEFLEDSNNTYNTFIKNKRIIKVFIEHLFVIQNIKKSQELDKYLNYKDRNLIKNEIDNNKLRMLDDEFVKKYRELLLKSIYDDKLKSNIRKKRAILYVISYTGNRTGEICTLDIDCLNVKSNYTLLRYKNSKASRAGNGEPILKEVAINKQVKDVIEFIIKEFNSKEYVFVKNKNNPCYTAQDIRNENIEFCIEYAKELGLLDCTFNDSFNGCLTKNYQTSKYIKNKIIKKLGSKYSYISYPWTEQFRVYIPSTLIDMGLPNGAISQMFWTNQQMLDDHYRKTPNQERNEFERKKRKGQILYNGSVNFDYTLGQCAFINYMHDLYNKLISSGYKTSDIEEILYNEAKNALRKENTK